MAAAVNSLSRSVNAPEGPGDHTRHMSLDLIYSPLAEASFGSVVILSAAGVIFGLRRGNGAGFFFSSLRLTILSLFSVIVFPVPAFAGTLPFFVVLGALVVAVLMPRKTGERPRRQRLGGTYRSR